MSSIFQHRAVVAPVNASIDDGDGAWMLSAICESADILRRAPSARDSLAAICRAITDSGRNAVASLDLLGAPPAMDIARGVSAGVAAGFLADAPSGPAQSAAVAPGPVWLAICQRRLRTVEDTRSDPLFASWKARAAEFDLRSAAIAPICVGPVVVAVLSVYAAAPGAFGETECAVLEQIAGLVSQRMASDSDRARRLEAERELVDSALRLEVLNATSSDLVLTLGGGGDIVSASAAVLRAGMSPGVPLLDLVHSADQVSVRSALRRPAASPYQAPAVEAHAPLPLRLRDDQGGWTWMEARVWAPPADDDDRLGRMLVLQDVTRVRALERALGEQETGRALARLDVAAALDSHRCWVAALSQAVVGPARSSLGDAASLFNDELHAWLLHKTRATLDGDAALDVAMSAWRQLLTVTEALVEALDGATVAEARALVRSGTPFALACTELEQALEALALAPA